MKGRLTSNRGKPSVYVNRKLEISFNGTTIKHNPTPKYLEVSSDRSLTHEPHLVNTAAEVHSRKNILQKLCDTTRGSTATILPNQIV